MKNRKLKEKLNIVLQSLGIEKSLWRGGVTAILLLLVCTVFLLPASATAALHVKDGLLLDAYGNPFIMRGVNYPHVWYKGNTEQSLVDIASVGSNTVRVVLGNGAQWGPDPAEEVADVIEQLKSLKMIVVLEVHDCTGYPEKSEAAPMSTATDYWLSIKDALVGQEDFVIINIANEPFGNGVPRAMWSDEHIKAITRLRDGGLKHCLMVDAANWGQDWEKIMLQDAPKVFAADPLKNIVFGVHMYQVYNNRNIIDNYLSTFVNEHKLPIVVGEFGADHMGEDVDETSILELAEYYHVGYLGWSWSGNSGGTESLDITLNFNLDTLSPWGDFLINSTYGIRNTSQLASVYTGGVPGVFPPSAIGQTVTVKEGQAAGITLSGSDLDGQIVEYQVIRKPQNGSLSGSGQVLVYTPNDGFTGSDGFQFTVTDNDGAISEPALVNITVVSSGGSGGTSACQVDYDVHNDWGSGAHINVTITNNLAEAINGWEMNWLLGDGEALSSGWNAALSSSGSTVTADADASHWNGHIAGSGGTVTFGMQIAKQSGSVHQPDAFTLNGLTCGEASPGDPVNTPSATGQSVTVNEGEVVDIILAGTDADGQITAYTVTRQPQNGSLSGNGRNLVYSPDTGFTGSDAFQFTVTDNDDLTSDPATVRITVASGTSPDPDQMCGKWDTASMDGGKYKIQNNVWGAETSQCISPLNDTGFVINSSDHHNTGGAPASYPSIWRGCHWQDCTTDSGMPIQASAVSDAVFSWQFKPITSGTWNATAEAWFKTTAEPGAPDGAELMIWLNHRGAIQPGGSKVDTVNLAGTSWDVWFTNSPGWNFVTYRRQTPVTSASVDMKPFMADAMARGYLESQWFLMDMEAGFEVWQGGAGLQNDSFAFEVNGNPIQNHPPAAKASATPTSGKPPLQVDFSAAGSTDPDGDDLTFTWDFGDNSNGTGVDTQHTYSAAGKYTATVTVSDSKVSDTAAIEIAVGTPNTGGVTCEYIVTNQWNTGFTANIRLTNNGDAAANGWDVDWQYTDGSRRTGGWNAHVTGNNPYNATPFDWNSNIPPGQSVEFGIQGAKGTENASAPVPLVTGDICGGSIPTNTAPDAVAEADVVSGDAPLKVTFDAGKSVDADGDALSYRWTFGDGDQSNLLSPAHTYNAPGVYTATVVVSDGALNDTASVVITVSGGSANTAPVAAATSDVNQGPAPLAVTFDASGSTDTDGDKLSYAWTFGDGGTAQGVAPTHTYQTNGTFTATVVVSDGVLNDTASVVITTNGDIGNIAPVAAATSDVSHGSAPLTVVFDASGSTDADGDKLTYAWSFGDGAAAQGVAPTHTYEAKGTYTATVTVSDGKDTATAAVEIIVTTAGTGGGAGFDNPFKGAKLYVDPIWSEKAAGEPGGDAIANYNTAVWMDRIGAITHGMGLRGHLDEAVAQGAELFMFVVYNLPNRDCAALASNGELRIAENGFTRYQAEYIDPIAEIISDPAYSDLRIVAIIEVDSLPNLVTNLNLPECQEANGPGGYRDGIRYALNTLSKIDNVYSYIDVAHSGWLGWSSNFGPAVSLIADVVTSTDQGWGSIAGFVTNVANYTPVEEPFLPDPNLNMGGNPIRSSSFYEWNDYLSEKTYAQAWREAMIATGAPATIGMLIDTARNGWGGPDRPTQASTSQAMEQFVDESRVDKREHRGNWCNQPGGIGYRPWPEPYAGIDAFVWVKPPGESDGISTPDFEPDPDDPAKQHDPMCDPFANNSYNPSVGTGALSDAPHAGRWFPEAFQILMQNAYPPLDEAPGPPPPPPAPPSDCNGLDPADPVRLDQVNESATLDLRCGPVYVQFPQPIPHDIFIDNTGDKFDVTIEFGSGSKSGSGYFWGTGISGVDAIKVIRNADANAVKIRWY